MDINNIRIQNIQSLEGVKKVLSHIPESIARWREPKGLEAESFVLYPPPNFKYGFFNENEISCIWIKFLIDSESFTVNMVSTVYWEKNKSNDIVKVLGKDERWYPCLSPFSVIDEVLQGWVRFWMGQKEERDKLQEKISLFSRLETQKSENEKLKNRLALRNRQIRSLRAELRK